jgi:signal transduction histidine kinase
VKQAVSISLLTTLLAVVALFSCSERQDSASEVNQADSLINAAYKDRDYDRLIQLADMMEPTGELSSMKAWYWRGYAYSRQRKMRLAESAWKKAVALDVTTNEDMDYYAKSANRLTGVLLVKGDYEATIREGVQAMNRLSTAGKDNSSDFAYIQTAIGCCQLKLGRPEDAANCFEAAYQKNHNVIIGNATIANFTCAIIGIITTTEAYLETSYFQEAYDWTERFATLLDEYKQLPDADAIFIDKQQARLCLFQASALEGLGNHTKAKAAYDLAMKTNYGQTVEGQFDGITYLMSAHRWEEAARTFEALDKLAQRYNRTVSLEFIQHFLLQKYRANLGAQRVDSALAIGTRICSDLDLAIMRMQQDEAMELATLYNTQQKETALAQQRADFARQRFMVMVVVLVFVVFCFTLIIYFRHQAAMRLENAYRQLEIANERTEESSRMKTSFIQQISHEIRTPLNILSGFTQIITTPDVDLDEDTKKDINLKISENTLRITELVNKMLELSDVSSKTVIERNDQVLAIQVAAQALSNYTLCDKYPIPIDLEVAEGADEVMMQTNEKAATRILELLLDNAEKFTKEGTIRLKVAEKNGMVEFVVEDTGIGIPASEAEHIFEEFVQLNVYEEGTGIGLTVARSISRRLGGDTFLDVSYHDGARFVVTLPAQVVQA